MANENPWLIGAGIGGNVLGAYLQNKQMNKQNQKIDQSAEWMKDLGRQESARRDLFTGAVLPSIGRDMRLPQQQIDQIGNSFGRLGAQAQLPQPAAPPPTPRGALGGTTIREGARTANTMTEGTGPEAEMNQKLAAISQKANTDPQGALRDLQMADQNYQNQLRAWIAAGGNQAKVAQQAQQNPKMNQTIQALYAQMGGQR